MIVQLITRMIRGGAQRIALETAAALRASGQEAEIWCGIEGGAEGSLLDEARARGVTVRTFPDLVKRVDPLRDLRAYALLAPPSRASARGSFTRTRARRESSGASPLDRPAFLESSTRSTAGASRRAPPGSFDRRSSRPNGRPRRARTA
jgi:hypothetical protein